MSNKEDLVRGQIHYTQNYKTGVWEDQKVSDAKRLEETIRLHIKPHSKLLDVGCGEGVFSKYLKEKHSVDVDAIDINQAAVDRARKNGLNAKKVDLEGNWPYKKGSFDIVLGVQVIEHLVNPDQFLRNAREVLRPGGVVVISTPNLAAWFNRVIFMLGYHPFFLEPSTVDKTVGLSFTKKLSPNRNPVGHIRVFTLKALNEILVLHGFRILENKGSTVNYLPKFMHFGDKLFSHFPSLSTDLVVVAEKP